MTATLLPTNRPQNRIVFVTGTDTDAGKTIFTGLALACLRGLGIDALAMKPFCSGSPGDVDLLYQMQEGRITKDRINPFYFPEAVAPLVAARLQRRRIRIDQLVARVCSLSTEGELLLVEGAGGLLAPLGEGFNAADVIEALACPVIVVARNRLGVINHTCLTVGELRRRKIRAVTVILNDAERTKKDLSHESNGRVLRELLAPVPVIPLPFLGANAASASGLKRAAKKWKKRVARMINRSIVAAR